MRNVGYDDDVCRWCGRALDCHDPDSDLCASCEAEELEAMREMEWDRRREEELMRRDGLI